MCSIGQTKETETAKTQNPKARPIALGYVGPRPVRARWRWNMLLVCVKLLLPASCRVGGGTDAREPPTKAGASARIILH